jgi:hypothetical protein
MGENIFEKFNSMVDVAGLKADAEAAASKSGGDFVEVPHGDYEVAVVKIELGETGEKSKTPGAPMAKVWFNVLAGEYKNQKIFMNQMLTSGFGIHKMNELLASLETGIPVVFENFVQYADLFKQIFAEVDGKAQYQLAYTANKKNEKFSEYTIVQRFKN